MHIPPAHILPELEANNRYDAIQELLRHLVKVGAIPQKNESELVSAFRLREETMTTGIGFGVAVPHISSNLVTKQILALGKSKKGIDFSSIDGNLVKEVILMISPPSDASTNAEQDAAANP